MKWLKSEIAEEEIGEGTTGKHGEESKPENYNN